MWLCDGVHDIDKEISVYGWCARPARYGDHRARSLAEMSEHSLAIRSRSYAMKTQNGLARSQLACEWLVWNISHRRVQLKATFYKISFVFVQDKEQLKMSLTQESDRSNRNQTIAVCLIIRRMDDTHVKWIAKAKIIQYWYPVAFVVSTVIHPIRSRRIHVGLLLFSVLMVPGTLLPWKCVSDSDPQHDDQTSHQSLLKIDPN